MQSAPQNDTPPAGAEEEASGSSPLELVQFALRATREHPVLAAFVGSLVTAIGVAIVSCIPQVYDATSKIFIQDSGANVTSGRTLGRHLEAARALDEFILARDNLAAIAREAKLFDTWPRTRALPMRVKDRITESLFGPPSRRDMERGFVEMLALSITAAKDGESVRIHGQWRDPQNAYDITRLVQRNFLAARAAYELGPIQRALPFLEAEVADTEREIEDAIVRIQAAQESKDAKDGKDSKDGKTAGTASAAKPDAAAPSGQRSAEIVTLSRELSETRQKLRALVQPARDRVAALKLELVELQASYSPDHPRVLQQQAKIAAASEASGEVGQLKARETELLSALAKATGRSPAELDPTPGVPGAGNDNGAAEKYELYPLQARLGLAIRKSEDVTARLQTARIELATAQADFQHRYVVVEEPEVPARPLKNKKPLLYAGCTLAGLLCAIAFCALRELRRGRIVEAWQVRSLGLPMLGEVQLKRLPADGEKS